MQVSHSSLVNSYQNGPMYVAWEAPDPVAQPYPIVLIHGGATQGTEWLDTPDGRLGWAQRGHGHSLPGLREASSAFGPRRRLSSDRRPNCL